MVNDPAAHLALVVPLAAGAFMLAAFAQVVTGFGSALVAVPLLALLLGPRPAVVVATTVSLLLTAIMWRRESGHVDLPAVMRVSVSGVLAMPLGLLLLLGLNGHVLMALMGVLVLGVVPLLARGMRTPVGFGAQWGAGALSGLLLTSTGMNGPPLILVLRDRDPRSFRATLQAAFCCQDVVAVSAFVLLGRFTGPVAIGVAAGVVGLPLGTAVGEAVFRRIRPQRFWTLVLCGLVVTGIAALVGAMP